MQQESRNFKIVETEHHVLCYIWAECGTHGSRYRRQINVLSVERSEQTSSPAGLLRALADLLETPYGLRP